MAVAGDGPWTSKGYSQYGASMGRRSDDRAAYTGKTRLQRVRLDSGGYDSGGAYWGIGEALWCAWDDEHTTYFRAADRKAAKALLPNARFYR